VWVPVEAADRLTALLRDKQVQYTWLRAAQARHADFMQVTADALDFALGMKVVWCNRYKQRRERPPGTPDSEITTLAELPPLIGRERRWSTLRAGMKRFVPSRPDASIRARLAKSPVRLPSGEKAQTDVQATLSTVFGAPIGAAPPRCRQIPILSLLSVRLALAFGRIGKAVRARRHHTRDTITESVADILQPCLAA